MERECAKLDKSLSLEVNTFEANCLTLCTDTERMSISYIWLHIDCYIVMLLNFSEQIVLAKAFLELGIDHLFN